MNADLMILAGLCGAIVAVLMVARPRVRHVSTFWMFQIAGWTVYGVAKYTLNPIGYPTVGKVVLLIVLGFGTTLILREILRAMHQRGRSAGAMLVAAIALSPLASAAWMLLFHVIDGQALFDASFTQAVLNKAGVLLAWCGLYVGITTWTDLLEERTARLQLAESAARAELQALRYQVNPHFLFNALNSISAMIDLDRDRARQMVRDLARFFRHSLRGAAGHVTLREELASIEDYLRIEQIRFEEKLVVNVALDDDAAGMQVPSLLLQPLVENAVKHGMRTSAIPLVVDIQARRNGDRVTITVRNSGTWRTDVQPGEGTHTGLENVRRRLAQEYGDRHSFTIAAGEGFVTVTLEIETAASAELVA